MPQAAAPAAPTPVVRVNGASSSSSAAAATAVAAASGASAAGRFVTFASDRGLSSSVKRGFAGLMSSVDAALKTHSTAGAAFNAGSSDGAFRFRRVPRS